MSRKVAAINVSSSTPLSIASWMCAHSWDPVLGCSPASCAAGSSVTPVLACIYSCRSSHDYVKGKFRSALLLSSNLRIASRRDWFYSFGLAGMDDTCPCP